MKCNYCGTELNPGQRFCHRCGTHQSAAPQPAPVPEQPAAPVQPVCQIPTPVIEPPRFDSPEPQSTYEPPKFEYQLPQSYYQPPDLNKPFPGIQPPAAPVPEPQPAAPAQRTAPQMAAAPVEAPHIQLPTGRSLAKMLLLGIITLGIYPFVIWNKIVTELNIAASRHDGERTVNFLGAGMLSVITLGIYAFVWIHGFCRRIGAELKRRSIDYSFGASAFWVWNFLSLIILALVTLVVYLLGISGAHWIVLVLGIVYLICPCVFLHKLMKSMNLINQDFNTHG